MKIRLIVKKEVKENRVYIFKSLTNRCIDFKKSIEVEYPEISYDFILKYISICTIPINFISITPILNKEINSCLPDIFKLVVIKKNKSGLDVAEEYISSINNTNIYFNNLNVDIFTEMYLDINYDTKYIIDLNLPDDFIFDTSDGSKYSNYIKCEDFKKKIN